MIEKIAANVVGQMTAERLIDKDQEDYYVYAIIHHAEQLITVGTILLISWFANEIVPTLFFLMFFLSLRKRTGGYHFTSFSQCYIGTIVIYIAVVGLNSIIISYTNILLIALLLSIGVIEWIGTVNHPNAYMNMEELSESKKAARILVMLEGGIIYFLLLIDANITCINYMSIAVILCAILLCMAKITRQEVKRNEEVK